MGKHKIRHSKTCLNCGSFVEKNYCPKCGQQNSESRQSFHHLFTHFVSDYLHYDSSFWKSIKCMLFHPGRLSKEYMIGKRKSYVNPFSLYIFISFVAFFIPSLLPYPNDEKETAVKAEKNVTIKVKDSIVVNEPNHRFTAARIDSLYRNSDPSNQIVSTDNIMYKMTLNVVDNMSDERKKEKLLEFFVQNIPKALFIYMPLFAFMLWLFHNKKKYYYFDSGIFTLHFFSVLLLIFTLSSILVCLCQWLDWNLITVFVFIFSIFYITFYFFRGSRVFYAEKRWVSNIKSFILINVNFVLILFVLIIYSLFTIYKILG